jgi:hypothetical protein
MKFIKSLLVVTVLMGSQVSFGQVSFSHSLGGSLYFSESTGAPAIMYSPRVNVLQLGDEITVSAGTHLGLGLTFNSQEGASSFALDVPIVAEINIGHGAHPDAESSFGGFAGIGFGISKIGSAGAFGSDYNDAAGLVLNGGIRAEINQRPIGLRVSYLINSKLYYQNVVGIGLFYTFGLN